jgi:DNA replication and repair protein RecF
VSFAFLRTVSFRNLADKEIDVRGKDIFFVGENGQGKTNFLEALYFCSYASSFRGAKDRDLVKSGENDCSVAVGFENSLYNKVVVAFKDGKKSITLDGKQVQDRKELLSVTPAVVFCHEDMEFVCGTPERRRWFFDQARSLWDPLYLDDLHKYRRLLKTRNSLFRKDGVSRPRLTPEISAMLDVLDPQMAHYGLELILKRQKLAADFSHVFQPLYREISDIDGIGVSYIPSWKNGDTQSITEHLLQRREADIAAGITLSGPHRDRYTFTCGGEDFSLKASTGQRRLLALLLRLAQAEVYLEKTGKKPVLLLDDVLLELDREKRKKFLSIMPEYEQAFYTFLLGEYERYLKADTIVYGISSGKAERMG